MRIDLSCPIELIAYQLPDEQQPYCSLVFFNLADKTVTSVQVTLVCYDDEGLQTLRRLMRVMDLTGERKKTFEALVPVEDNLTFSHIDLIVEKVWFDDNTVWRRTLATMHDFTPNELPPTRLREHLRFVAGQDAVGFPSDQGAVWVCVCGRPNAASEGFCRRCGRDRAQQFEKYNRQAVEKVIEQRERELEEKATRARLEASEKEHQRMKELQRKQRKRRILTVTAIVLVVLLAGAAVFVQFGLPEMAYRQAQAQLAAGSAEEAKLAFEVLGSYRDSADMVRQSEYQAALSGLSSTSGSAFEYSLSRMKALGDYADAPEQVKIAILARAKHLMAQADYIEALPLLEELGAYEDARELRSETLYEIAQQEVLDKAYEEASAHFAEAGAYHDAPARAEEALYLAAGAYAQAEDYAKAASLYASIPDYEDSLELARANVYADATLLMDAGQYEEAQAKFVTLGAYRDSVDKAQECVYLPAVLAMHAGHYDQAYELLITIPDYPDAAGLAEESLYLAGVDAQNKGELETAVEKFAAIPEYKDAGQRLSASTYEQANQLEVAGSYTAAAEMFESLGDFDDSADRALNVRYLSAQSLMQEKQYPQAKVLFAALGNYSNAARMVQECDYRLATDMMDAGNLQGASELFASLGNYEDAADKANLCLYRAAEDLMRSQRYEEAAAAFAALGKYEDAAAKANECKYQLATLYEQRGEYQQAGQIFTDLEGYSDARERAENVYETWLGSLRLRANEAILAENYGEALFLLEDLPFGELPEGYRDLATLYENSVLNYAKHLINTGNKLLARPYLERVKNLREARRLLDDFMYRIIGGWESAGGSILIFRDDGTCYYDGNEGYFNVTDYALMIGDTPYPYIRTHSIIDASDSKLSLRREGEDSIIKYSRIPEDTLAAMAQAKAPQPTAKPQSTPEPTQEPETTELPPEEDNGDQV